MILAIYLMTLVHTLIWQEVVHGSKETLYTIERHANVNADTETYISVPPLRKSTCKVKR